MLKKVYFIKNIKYARNKENITFYLNFSIFKIINIEIRNFII